MPKKLLIIVALSSVVGAEGCATHTKGTWACPADRGITCQNIDSLDHIGGPSRPSPAGPASVEGGAAVRWWSATDALTGNFDRAPRREPDQVMKVVIAGWSDAAGDYHAPSEVFAVMRRGGWWAPPPAAPLTQPPAQHTGEPARTAKGSPGAAASPAGEAARSASGAAPPPPALAATSKE